MGNDWPLPQSWYTVADRWKLAPDQLPEAVQYVRSVLRVIEGELQLLEMRVHPWGERHIYGSTDPALASLRVVADRPANWHEDDELRAIEDVYIALTHDIEGDRAA